MASTSKSHKKDTREREKKHSTQQQPAQQQQQQQKEEIKDIPDDDWDGKLDISEYEATMDLNIRKMIAAESQFQKTLVILRDLKLRQLKNRREEVYNGESLDLMDRNKSAYSDCKEKDEAVEKLINLHLDVLDRQVKGMIYFAEHGQKDTYEAYKAKLEEDLLAEEAEIVQKLQDVEAVTNRIRAAAQKNKFSSMKDFLNPPKKVKMGANYKKIEKTRKKLKIPVVVYKLTERELKEDMSFFDDAIKATHHRENPMEA